MHAFRTTQLLGLITAASTASLASAATINVDFAPDINDGSVSSNIYTVDYVGTAAAPDAGTTWNAIDASTPAGAAFIDTNIGYYDEVDGGTGTAHTLVDSYGNSTGISLTFNNDEGGAFAVSDNAGNLANIATDAQGLMRDYLIAFAQAQTITLSGFSAGEMVDLYMYGEGDNTSNNRSTLFEANGVSGFTTGDAGAAPLTDGMDYVVLSGVAADANGDILISYATNGTDEGPFNGFQVVQVPEPASLSLLGLAAAGLCRRRQTH